ncbi:MAG: hypothetical protein AAFP26_14395, partial [Planctomycetota bacterium]
GAQLLQEQQTSQEPPPPRHRRRASEGAVTAASSSLRHSDRGYATAASASGGKMRLPSISENDSAALHEVPLLDGAAKRRVSRAKSDSTTVAVARRVPSRREVSKSVPHLVGEGSAVLDVLGCYMRTRSYNHTRMYLTPTTPDEHRKPQPEHDSTCGSGASVVSCPLPKSAMLRAPHLPHPHHPAANPRPRSVIVSGSSSSSRSATGNGRRRRSHPLHAARLRDVIAHHHHHHHHVSPSNENLSVVMEMCL